MTLTISNGNHVNLQGTKAGGNMNANISKVTENSEQINARYISTDNKPSIFALKNGDVIRTVVTLSAQHTHQTPMSIYLVKANDSATKDIFNATTSGEKTIELTEDFDVGTIGMWTATSVNVVDYDVKVFVNNIRYV